MINKELLGLYLEKDHLNYVSISKGVSGTSLKRLGLNLADAGIFYGKGILTLRDFLQEISPKKRRDIYLTLPRALFFVRDLELPQMYQEEALLSIQNSLPVYSHLPAEEIYFDVHLCFTAEKKINALIYYASRKSIDAYKAIFMETGHINSLKAIFPVSYGIGAWMNQQLYPMDIGLIVKQDETNELAVYQKKGCLFSMTWPAEDGEREGGAILEVARGKFARLEEMIYYLESPGEPLLPVPTQNRLGKIPIIQENLGAAALAPHLANQQVISVDGRQTQLKKVKVFRYIVPVILLLLLLAGGLTHRLQKEITTQRTHVQELKSEIQKLRKKIKPLEENKATVEKAEKFQKDVDEFLKVRPRLFTYFNDVATLMPEGTWFSNVNFDENSGLRLKGKSSDALQVLEMLRGSEYFDQVKLSGPVRRRGDKEDFTIHITLKDPLKAETEPQAEAEPKSSEKEDQIVE